ncbi:YceK/YidQ family lipoprotein [Pseudomonas sp. SWRI92]|uniref:YceK/YidQ family lipoprotein n=1 Tax=Pseudomonas sp. SWRI92 TaxID=2745499 RepID=UPI001645ACCB|nr:YceK/YidQ family lipoprotein [Pseudomonas sp. SWRI92]MBC3375878.1 YceK/YidQ family lipoprotein [Pseudomonas sp. SWRI92]
MRIIGTALIIALLTGCATANETFGTGGLCGVSPYCGVYFDYQILKEAVTEDNSTFASAFAPFAAIDLPLSFVADTLILPYTIFHMRPSEE